MSKKIKELAKDLNILVTTFLDLHLKNYKKLSGYERCFIYTAVCQGLLSYINNNKTIEEYFEFLQNNSNLLVSKIKEK
jgi:hypothetical protein